MIGTLVNVGTVVAGTVAGRVAGKRIPDRILKTLTNSIALVILGIGVLDVKDMHNGPLVFGSLLAGAVVGEVLKIEEGLAWIGTAAQKRFGTGESSDSFAQAFVTTSLLFCVGPLTILGSLEDGMSGDYSKLLVKSALDGISSLAISTTLGWGVLLSAVTVLIVQGGITLAASTIKPLLTSIMITEMSAVGGLILIAMGLNILGLTRIRTASLLPALIIALICSKIWD